MYFLNTLITNIDSTQLLEELGNITRWLQAFGVIFVLWLIFQIINTFINQKKIKRLNKIEKRLETIEKRLKKSLRH